LIASLTSLAGISSIAFASRPLPLRIEPSLERLDLGLCSLVSERGRERFGVELRRRRTRPLTRHHNLEVVAVQ
jgi:hypothetical protein